MVEKKRDSQGMFVETGKKFIWLLKSDAVKNYANSVPPTSRDWYLYVLNDFLEYNNLGPDEFLSLPDEEVKKCIKRACLAKIGQQNYSAARKMFYAVVKFLEINGREIHFTRTEKKALIRYVSKKDGKRYIPTREEIYRIVDSLPTKSMSKLERLRAKALILCLWQSGVRVNCLLSWTWGMFKKKLYPEPEIPVPIKVVALRPKGVWDVAQDIKLAKYGVGYYYTFLHREAAYTLKEYLDARIEDGWIPKDHDPIWVTHKKTKNKPLKPINVRFILKNACANIGIKKDHIWTHCFRAAFRKTLYQSGVDLDIAEAMMGHKLPGSRGNYFDYHDLEFLKQQYMKGFWERIGINRIKKLEREVAELRRQISERQKRAFAYDFFKLPLEEQAQIFEQLKKAWEKVKKQKP